MNARMWSSLAAGSAALLLTAALATDAEAQTRTSGVRISSGHVYVGGQHVGAIRGGGSRTGLARIVNPQVGRLGPGFRRPADARAGGFGPPNRFGDRFRAPTFRERVDGRFGDRSDRFGPRRAPRIGANGILLGGEIPLVGSFFCPRCAVKTHPFLFAHPFFPVFPVLWAQGGWAAEAGPTDVEPWEAEPRARTPERRAPLGPLVIEPEDPEPPREWDGPCAGVTVRMVAGTSHWLRVPLRSLGVDTPEAAQRLLDERIDEGTTLALEGFSGGGLVVPAGLVESVSAEACPADEEEGAR